MTGERSAGFPQGMVLVLPATLTVMGSVILAPVLPLLMDAFADLPNRNFWVPALLTVPGLCTGLLAPLFGLAGDRLSKRSLLIACTIFYALVGVLPVVLQGFVPVLVARVGLGIAETGVLVLSTALIGDYFSGAQRDRWISGQTIAATCAALALLPLGGLMGAWLGWRGPFYLYAAALPLACLIWLLTWERPVAREARGPAVGWSALPWTWLIGVCAVTLFVSVLFYTVQLQIGLALAARGTSDPGRIGLLAAAATLGVPVGAVLFWKLSRVSLERMLSGQFLGAGATLFLLGHVSDERLFVALAFCNLMACGLMLPTMLTHVARRLDEPVRGRGIGIWQACFSLGQFASVGVTALVMGVQPGASILEAFSLLGICALIAAAIAGLLVFRAAGRRSLVLAQEA